jgi:hypothetical protein
MKKRLRLEILPQPDDFTCGPTALHAVYNYFGDAQPLARVIEESPRLENGGTLAVNLAIHALQRGYRATIFTFNLQVFDPTWFDLDKAGMLRKLDEQREAKKGRRRVTSATRAYVKFLNLGGELRYEDLTPPLIRRYLNKGVPILTGLSSTHLYKDRRERDEDAVYDDIRGVPTGHFVVLCGYDRTERSVAVADPFFRNPVSRSGYYNVDMDRLINAILLGVLTYDANMLILRPGPERKRRA